VQQGQLEEQLGGRRDPQIAAGRAGQKAEVLFERLENLVGVQVQIADDLAEHVPLDLRERQADVLVGQQRVIAAARLVQGAIHDALG
jgi:hypothetical protein